MDKVVFLFQDSNKKLNGEHSFLLEIDFTLQDDRQEKKTFFFIPSIIMIVIRIFLYNDGQQTHTKVLPNVVKPF